MRKLIPSLLACSALGFAAERAEPLNVVLICVDDLKPVLGCYGDTAAKTPNIDRLARQGVLFQRAYVEQAVCCPARNSLLTGLRPDQLGIYNFQRFRSAAPEAISLPQSFMLAGWRAEAVGKVYDTSYPSSGDDPASWTFPHVDPRDRIPDERPGDATAAGAATMGRRLGHPWAWPDCPDELAGDARSATYAVARLDELAVVGRPFFFAVGFVRPHLPFRVPKRWWDLFDRAALPQPAWTTDPLGSPVWAGNSGFGELRGNYNDIPKVGPLTDEQARTMVHGYYASTAFADAQIGRVLDKLESAGLMQRTIVVLWGDHGWHLGDHGWWCKHTNYEQATRNPVIIAAPGMARGAVTAALMATTDLYPTICELAGIRPPAGLTGRSLVPVLKDPGASVQDAVLSMYPRTVDGQEVLGRALRTDRHRYIAWQRFDEPRTLVSEELYDYATDPDETRSLATEPAQQALLEGFRARLAALPAPLPQVPQIR